MNIHRNDSTTLFLALLISLLHKLPQPVYTNYHSQSTQITTASLHKYEVHINKQTSTVPQQAQDSQCLAQFYYINNLREHSYFDVDDRIILKQILKNEEWLGLAQDRKKKLGFSGSEYTCPIKRGEFFDYLGYCWLLKNSAPG